MRAGISASGPCTAPHTTGVVTARSVLVRTSMPSTERAPINASAALDLRKYDTSCSNADTGQKRHQTYSLYAADFAASRFASVADFVQVKCDCVPRIEAHIDAPETKAHIPALSLLLRIDSLSEIGCKRR